MLRQQKFLKNILLKLDASRTASEVVDTLFRLRNLVTDSSRMRVHVSANVRKLRAVVDPIQPWMDGFMKNINAFSRQK